MLLPAHHSGILGRQAIRIRLFSGVSSAWQTRILSGMPKVFISYRRSDSAAVSGRIYDHLTQALGRRQVFKDVDDIPPGVDFPTYIEQSLSQSDLLLAIIGPHWLEARGPAGPRLLEPADFVRVEIETGFRLGLTVIPLLVDGATMPAAEALPASLQALARLNAVVVRNDPDFRRDMQRVIAATRATPGRQSSLFGRRRSNAGDTSGQPDAPAIEHAPHGLKAPTSSASEGLASPQAPGARAPESAGMRGFDDTRPAQPIVRPTSTPARPAPSTVASASQTRATMARRPLALAAAAFTLVMAVTLVAALKLHGVGAVSLTRGAYATQTAKAKATGVARAYATWVAITSRVKPVSDLPYTTANPGCDTAGTTYWVPPIPGAGALTCSPSAMTITGPGLSASVSAGFEQIGKAYAVQVTVTNLIGVCAIELAGDNDKELLTLEKKPSGLAWEISQMNGENWQYFSSGSVNLADSYTIRLLVSATQPVTGGYGAINPDDLSVTINGNVVRDFGVIPVQGSAGMTLSPGALTYMSLALYSNSSLSYPTNTDTVTFSNFRVETAT